MKPLTLEERRNTFLFDNYQLYNQELVTQLSQYGFFLYNADSNIQCQHCGMRFQPKDAQIAIEIHTLLRICPPADRGKP